MPPDTEDCQLSLPLQVQAPMPDLPAADAVAERLRRVVLGGQLCHFRLRRARRRAHRLRWADGAVVHFLGEELTLKLRAADGSAAVRVGRELQLALPAGASEAEVRALVQDWFRHQAIRILGDRVNLLAARGAVRPYTWRLSSARTQWGSCNEDGRIRLNWRLVFFPIPVIDYVVAHELAHLTELNHGRAFWHEVERLLPDFRAARDQIKNEELAALPL